MGDRTQRGRELFIEFSKWTYLRGHPSLLQARQVGVRPRARGPRRYRAQVLVEPGNNAPQLFHSARLNYIRTDFIFGTLLPFEIRIGNGMRMRGYENTLKRMWIFVSHFIPCGREKRINVFRLIQCKKNMHSMHLLFLFFFPNYNLGSFNNGTSNTFRTIHHKSKKNIEKKMSNFVLSC